MHGIHTYMHTTQMLMCWAVWSNVPVPVGVVVASAVVVSLAAVR